MDYCELDYTVSDDCELDNTVSGDCELDYRVSDNCQLDYRDDTLRPVKVAPADRCGTVSSSCLSHDVTFKPLTIYINFCFVLAGAKALV